MIKYTVCTLGVMVTAAQSLECVCTNGAVLFLLESVLSFSADCIGFVAAAVVVGGGVFMTAAFMP